MELVPYRIFEGRTERASGKKIDIERLKRREIFMGIRPLGSLLTLGH